MEAQKYPSSDIYRKLEYLKYHPWKHNLGDGKTSERIAKDLIQRLLNDKIYCHRPQDYHLPIKRSYRNDGLK